MTRVAVVADSGCDLPAGLVERYGIGLVSLIARFGDDELLDTPATRELFWARYEQGPPPQSAAPGAGAWAEAFEAALQRADEVIALTITSRHSATYNGAVLAAADFGGRVHVFDSWSVSLGEGLLVLHAARQAEAGAPAATILAELADLRARLWVGFVLESLEAVQRGGRLAPVIAAIKRMGSLLAIKPVLAIREGTIGLEGAARSMRRGIQSLIERVPPGRVFMAAVGHTRRPELAQAVADALATAAAFPRQDILIGEIGPALAVHAGPGAIGLGFILT